MLSSLSKEKKKKAIVHCQKQEGHSKQRKQSWKATERAAAGTAA